MNFYTSRAVVSNFSMYQNYPESLFTHRLLDPLPRVSDSVGLGGVGESAYLTGSHDVHVTSPGLHLESYCFGEGFIA